MSPHHNVHYSCSYRYFSTSTTLPGSKLKSCGSAQKLKVEHRSYTGGQWSLFYNPDRAKEPHNPHNVTWNEDYYITSSKLNITLTLGGNAKVGSLHYIEAYGFYEGGVLNRYRVDPVCVVAVLTGLRTRALYQVLCSRQEAQLLNARRRREEAKAMVEKLLQSNKDHPPSQVEEITRWATDLDRDIGAEITAFESALDSLAKSFASVLK